MVEIFKTNLNSRENAHLAESWLILFYPNLEVSFDLEDPDKVLRVQSKGTIDKLLIFRYFKNLGYLIQLIK